MSGALREIKKEARGKKREAGRREVEKNREEEEEEEEEEDVNSPRPVEMTQSDHFLFGRCCR